jgi:hypothetical protein
VSKLRAPISVSGAIVIQGARLRLIAVAAIRAGWADHAFHVEPQVD